METGLEVILVVAGYRLIIIVVFLFVFVVTWLLVGPWVSGYIDELKVRLAGTH